MTARLIMNSLPAAILGVAYRGGFATLKTSAGLKEVAIETLKTGLTVKISDLMFDYCLKKSETFKKTYQAFPHLPFRADDLLFCTPFTAIASLVSSAASSIVTQKKVSFAETKRIFTQAMRTQALSSVMGRGKLTNISSMLVGSFLVSGVSQAIISGFSALKTEASMGQAVIKSFSALQTETAVSAIVLGAAKVSMALSGILLTEYLMDQNWYKNIWGENEYAQFIGNVLPFGLTTVGAAFYISKISSQPMTWKQPVLTLIQAIGGLIAAVCAKELTK